MGTPSTQGVRGGDLMAVSKESVLDIELTVSRWLLEDGESAVTVKQTGTATTDVVLGMLEVAKFAYAQQGMKDIDDASD